MTTMTTTEPITKEIHVAAGPETAFKVFTERIGEWWPLERFSVFEEGTTVAFEADRIVERRGTDETVWGEVLAFEAAARVRFTWHPGLAEDEEPTKVEVTFTADGDGTLVTLVHSGWERLREERLEGRAGYDSGWPLVLERYSAAI